MTRDPGHSHERSELCRPDLCTGHETWDEVRRGQSVTLTPEPVHRLTADLSEFARRTVRSQDYVDDNKAKGLPGLPDLNTAAVTTISRWCDLFPTLSTADAIALAREYAAGRPARYTEDLA